MDTVFEAMPDVAVLPAHFPVPGAGVLPVNAFVIKAKEPVLVDTGMGIDTDEFMKALESVIDPKDLKWVWLTHDDADHTGSIQAVLEAAPNARLATNSLAALRMSSAWPVPLDRAYWLNPGDSISAGDRELTAVRPPMFDNPTTIGMVDSKSKAFFCADFFGALIPGPAQYADDVAEGDLAQGMTFWASVDSPWAHMVAPDVLGKALDNVRQLAPTMLFSAHLPPAKGKTEQFLELLATVPAATPAVAPDQAALGQILAQMKGGN